jgi:putative ABC transport system substrate-binding protein
MKKNISIYSSLIAYLTIILLFGYSCDFKKEKTYVVGIVNPSAGLVDVVKGFKEGMEDHGYHEGRNITYLYDGPLDGVESIDAEISEIIAKDPDLIYSLTTPASKKLNKALANTDIPGVFAPVFDPVSAGIVNSLARPGGQMTGVKVRGSTAKALEWLLKIDPDVKQIFVPFHITDKAAWDKAACLTVEDLQATADKLNITLITEDVTNTKELESALNRIPANTDAIWLTCSHLLFSNVDKIVKAAEEQNIPVASSTHSRQRSGILVAYGEHDIGLGKQAARLADKLLKGASPQNVPVETAEYILVINLETAAKLGITVPDTVLKQADDIIRK